MIDQSRIRKAFLDAGAVKVFIQPTVERAVRARVAEMHADLSEIQALELWIASQDGNLGCDADELRRLHAEYVARLGQT